MQMPLLTAAARAGMIELLAGNPAAAVEALEDACSALEQIGQRAWLSTIRGHLAQAHYALGHLDCAYREAQQVDELATNDNVVPQMLSRQVKAKVLARRNDHDEAERLAREAVALGEQTQALNAKADARRDLAEVLHHAGRPDEARNALAAAIDRYQRKGNLAAIEIAQTLLASPT
jgi:tetratricopeptide (TPR) repeat protein